MSVYSRLQCAACLVLSELLAPACLQGVGHIPMDECPGRLTELLVDFVRQEVAAAAGTGMPQ